MTDVVIHRCRLRLVRRGGWSWGPRPRRVADAARSTLPRLLAEALGRVARGLEAGEEARLAVPVRVRLPVRLRQLEAAPEELAAELGPRLEAALRGALARRLPGLGAPPVAEPEASGPDDPARPGSSSPSSRQALGVPAASAAGRLADLLERWRRSGRLYERLAALPEEVTARWERALERAAYPVAPGTSGPAGTGSERAAAEALRAVLAAAAARPGSATPAGSTFRLAVWVEAAARAGLGLGNPHLRSAVASRLSAPGSAAADAGPAFLKAEPSFSASRGETARGTEAGAEPTGAAAPQALAAAPAAVRSGWQVEVPSALPFLVLGPLARIGYFETLEALLPPIRVQADSSLFAAALARKVLPLPRGGRLSEALSAGEGARAAAVCGGRPEAVEDSFLAGLARRVAHRGLGLGADLVSILDREITDNLLAGRSERARPWWVYRAHSAPGGWLLIEEEGLFPLAWEGSAGELAALLASLRTASMGTASLETAAKLPPLLAPPSSADPALLAALRADGWTVHTDAPPTRGETGIGRGSLSPGVRAALRDLPALDAEVERFAEELGRRPALPRREGAEPEGDEPALRLERSLSLAAAFALGSLAWILWRDRETPSPWLALERFADLGARVSFEAERVRVLLPMGRRRFDLGEHGLLRPVPGLPWLGGRVLEFGGS